MSKKKVCIIYTGGTIGMTPTEHGFAPISGTLTKQLEDIRDMHSDAMPDWDLIEYDPLLDSSNIDYKEWNMMAETIDDRFDDYDGFVILHGTDTMAYSASALSFMIEGLNKPIVFTGSQIPLCELRSDGKDNLISSVLVAADGIANEVCIYFGNHLLRGNRSMKFSSDDLMAFNTPDYPALATAGINIEYNYRALSNERADLTRKPLIRKIKESRLGVIKLFPGMHFDLFRPIVEAKPDGIILEAFGAGNIPSNDPNIISFIRESTDAGAVIVVCTQCPQGSVALGTYEAGSALVKAGAVSGYDMTTEAAVAKLYYLLSRGYSKKEIRYFMETNLRGELTR